MTDKDTLLRSQITAEPLLSEAKALAARGERGEARARLEQLLSLAPDRTDALLWLAAIAEDPAASERYLERVLEREPNHPAALAGLEWARGHREPASVPRRSSGWAWLDRLLIGGIAVICAAALVLLLFIAWQAPEAVRAAYHPTLTPTPSHTATPAATLTAVPTFTATPTLTPTSAPTVRRTTAPANTPLPAGASDPALTTPLGRKWIQIDLSEQRLTAYEGETQVLAALVSTGVDRLPTPRGTHEILVKVRRQRMSGPGYSVPNVEFVSYFLPNYAIHGTYWHDNFGQPMSHGCVNMRNDDAQWIYDWAPIGTPVKVRQ